MVGGFLIAVLLIAACGTESGSPSAQFGESNTPVVVSSVPFRVSEPCSGGFVRHTLDHVVTADAEVPGLEGFGAGLALGDIDADGDIDIVLGSIADAVVLATNDGAWGFEVTEIAEGPARGVLIVDDGGSSGPEVWLSPGTGPLRRLVRSGDGWIDDSMASFGGSLPWVSTVADVDGDGDLDVVTASYDLVNSVLTSGEITEEIQDGVWFWRNDGETFSGVQLASASQALALLVVDLDDDGVLDLFVGNDFDFLDQRWEWAPEGFVEQAAGSVMSMHTMSFAADDLVGNGSRLLFTTDMRNPDEVTSEFWDDMAAAMALTPEDVSGPQMWQNTLVAGGMDSELAAGAGLDRTGWSWSAKFGDLDLDGDLDGYVVNGMIGSQTLASYPPVDVIDTNYVFQNDGSGTFDSMPSWGLDAIEQGRSMSMADLDLDGDLDIVVSNVNAPVTLFENQVCTTGSAVQVDLVDLSGANRLAIGAELVLVTTDGELRRRVHAQSGFLSGDPSRIHFGLAASVEVERLVVQWPDGVVSEISGADLAVGSLYRVERDG